MASDWNLFVDSNFVQSAQYDTSMTLVLNQERVLGGLYHF